MPTNEEITEVMTPRDLNTLLALNTYQDMSDEEIESIITYKTTYAYNNGINSANVAATGQALQDIIDGFAQHRQQYADVIQSIVGYRPLRQEDENNE